MTVSPDILRRVEQLETIVRSQATLIAGMTGRDGTTNGRRQMFLAKTIRVGGSYPASGNTFGLRFIDREFTPAEGTQAATDHPRSANWQVIGQTLDGSYVEEHKPVMVFPTPPAKGTSGNGRWVILPPKAPAEDDGIPFLNVGVLPHLPYFPMLPVGTITIDGVHHIMTTQNFTGNFSGLYLINGPTTVPNWVAGPLGPAIGKGSWRMEDTGPVALYEGYAGLVSPGLELGVMPVLQALELNRPGFIALSDSAFIDGQLVVMAQQHPVRMLFGKARIWTQDQQQKITQNAARSIAIEFDIFHRVGLSWYYAGWQPLICFLPLINTGETLKHGTWGRVDFISSKWEGDFACDPDQSDTGGQAGGGQDQGWDPWQMPNIEIIEQGQDGAVGMGIGT